ncbi:DUF7426 family protein [Glycomyces paridis]|uniref:DUF7426 family protein n=1 Tax=Glycomyces paridis TaxID=2126555 RepID=UPI0013051F37|nr:hypothetical protein [Glycomyces paridis]
MLAPEKAVWENEDGDLVVVLDLPSGATEFVIEDVSAATGLWVHALTEKTRKAHARMEAGEDAESIDADLHLTDEQESDMYTRTLGSTLDDLEAAGARWRHVRLMGQIAYAWITRGLKGARSTWESGGVEGEPNRQTRRAQSRASGSKTKAAGASASTTKPRASTSRTKPRA